MNFQPDSDVVLIIDNVNTLRSMYGLRESRTDAYQALAETC